MSEINYKELLCGHLKELYDDANVLQKRWEVSRVQARNRSRGSDVLDDTPSEKVRNQNHDSMRQEDRSHVQRGDP